MKLLKKLSDKDKFLLFHLSVMTICALFSKFSLVIIDKTDDLMIKIMTAIIGMSLSVIGILSAIVIFKTIFNIKVTL